MKGNENYFTAKAVQVLKRTKLKSFTKRKALLANTKAETTTTTTTTTLLINYGTILHRRLPAFSEANRGR